MHALDSFVQSMSAPPVKMTWTYADLALKGECAGMVVMIWRKKVEVSAHLPIDAPDLAQRNAQLLRRVLCDMRPKWEAAWEWLAAEMFQSYHISYGAYAAPCGDVVYAWDSVKQRATLTIGR